MDYLNTLRDSLSQTIGGLLPGVFGALLVLIVGLILASAVSKIIRSLFNRTSIDERIVSKMNLNFNLARFVSKLVYWLLVLLVLLTVLEMMGLSSVLDPLRSMLAEFFGAIPRIIQAGVIGFLGYAVAKLASEGVGFVSTSINAFSSRIGFSSPQGLLNIIKQLVFIFIFIPILIIALDTLGMTAISEPASSMFEDLLAAIPKIIGAAIILAVVYFVGRYVVTILTELLQNMGADTFATNLGLGRVLGKASFSKVIGNVAFFFIVFAGLIAALEKLEMHTISQTLNDVLHISGNVFFGLIILVAGSFVADLASKAMNNADKLLGTLVRFAVLGVFVAFALHTMGIAQSIVNLAFGLILGAVAVAFALAFGLGGREAAGKQLEKFFDRLNKK